MGVLQYQNENGHYFTINEMVERTKELFGRFLRDRTLHVHPNPYHFPDVDQVTPTWLRDKMIPHQITLSQINKTTGMEKDDLSRWIEGKRPMTQQIKLMFYFMILSMEKASNQK